MIVYGVMMLVSIVYLTNIPVTIRLHTRVGGTASCNVEISMFGRDIYQKPLDVLDVIGRLGKKKPRSGGSRRAYSYLIHHASWRAFVHFAMPDACQTAQVAGALGALGALLRVKTHVRADFMSVESYAVICGIASTKLGHIMLAALWRLMSIVIWRKKTWRNIRSKAS